MLDDDVATLDVAELLQAEREAAISAARVGAPVQRQEADARDLRRQLRPCRRHAAEHDDSSDRLAPVHAIPKADSMSGNRAG
ncbi:MAG TPA: hypothetical protein VLD35_07045 [Caldimonas sp.]|nr:hypothetical protein [Caldimonas sp.]